MDLRVETQAARLVKRLLEDVPEGMVICPNCGGDGAFSGADIGEHPSLHHPCFTCGTSGYVPADSVKEPTADEIEANRPKFVDCPECGGNGANGDWECSAECGTCKGHGSVPADSIKRDPTRWPNRLPSTELPASEPDEVPF